MPEQELFTSEEAVREFVKAGLSETTFRRKVREEKVIDKILPEGRARGALYPADQVREAIKQSRGTAHHNNERTKRTVPDVVLDWVKPEDVPSGLALDQIVYNEMFLASAEVYMAWRRKNPKISMGAFDANDRRTRYGYIGLIPLPEPIILDVLMGRKDEKEITPDEILTYDEPGEYTLLANSAVIHPSYPELANRILHGIMQFWIDQYPEKRIKRIYAQTVSEQGTALAKKLYLSPLYLMGSDGLVRVKDAYVLDMNEKAVSKVIRLFQEQLEAKSHLNQK
ncbi:hypothetical protein [Ktedonobacter racemifer]|uniref:Uncharacterized protein n=1 Tax=Ktedonobacter racemifer DSM 44963 TaxID=485913 RepID=D6TNE1_KTERA|nr:hypothetical protein [Ktedonobacter racemifer]EFH87272.1 hypothetical protein Krac_8602 [Ktedonobacter racemifer DSM 44963]